MKKVLSLMLCIIMALGVMSTAGTVFAETAGLEYGSTYNASENLVEYVLAKETDSHGSTKTYSYNAMGQLTKKVYTYTDEYKITETDTNTYDSAGRLTKSAFTYVVAKHSDLNYSGTSSYTYNSKGLVTKAETVTKGDDADSTTKITYTYDANGNCTKYDCKGVGDYASSEYTTRKFNSNNQQIEAKSIIDTYYDGRTTLVTKTTYDKINRVSKESGTLEYDYGEAFEWNESFVFNGNGDILKDSYTQSRSEDGFKNNRETLATYDKDGKLIKSITTHSQDGEVDYTERENCTYNAKGLLVKDIFTKNFGWNAEITTITYAYDSKDRVKTKTEVYDINDNKETVTTAYTYNSNGLVSKEVETDKDGSVTRKTTTENSYDSHANKTKEILTIEVTGEKTYKNTTTFTYKKLDKKACIINDTIYLSAYSYTEDGKEKKPNVYIKNNLPGDNYKVSYKNNTKAGKGQVIITFVGDDRMCKPITINFDIKKAEKKPVTGLKQSAVTATTFKLAWTKFSGAKYYKLEQSTDGKTWKTVKTLDTNTVVLKSLKAGTKYQFRVTALDKNKKAISKTSAVLKTQTLCVAPSATVKSTKSKTATVSWKAVTGGTKYVVKTSKDNKTWTTATTTTKTSATISKLSAGKKIYVKVQAINAYNQKSAYSKVVNVTVKK